MRALHALVFEELLFGSWNNSQTSYSFYTSHAHASRLGAADKLAIHLVADNYATTGSPGTVNLLLAVEHSADGWTPSALVGVRNDGTWMQKNATPEIQSFALSTNTTFSKWGAEGGQNPSLALIRFRLDLAPAALIPGIATAAIHVKVYATTRDIDAAVTAHVHGGPPVITG